MDAPTIPGWTVKWSGWLEPANYIVLIGRWLAWRNPDEGFLVATTLGTVGHADPFGAVDTARQRGWPIITPASTDEERETVKQRALDLLKDQIRQAA